MLDQRKVIAALAAKRDEFRSYERDRGSTMESYRERWLAVARLSREEIEARLRGHVWPGARPSAEHDRHRAPTVPFAERWENHEQARAWAGRVLLGVTTLAVDGSQITPSRDFSLPVGAVQIGRASRRERV